ncbi:hypothetical protein Hypma_014059 [Hypsizygus marmoreus]|uniref:F-box domain-containing protein n=1 Tax=Hypsizygus marmoreus TaxID=39966 RepID=A0A369KDT4_HYPMA|nr:hypothetical protein Hypma_014059 [Hypsizygus marmoreus]
MVIAHTRLANPLLGNLRILRFSAYDDDDNLLYYLPFMVSTVLHFKFQLAGRGAWRNELSSHMRLFFDTISSRMTNLSSLSITALSAINFHSPRFIGLLAHALEGLPNLKHVILPPRVIVGKIITSLSDHARLVEINPAERALSRGLSSTFSSTVSSTVLPKLGDAPFPSLRSLSFCAIPKVIRGFLSHPRLPTSQIAILHVQVLESSARDHERLDHLMNAIFSNCTNLAELSISETIRGDDDPEKVENIFSFNCIRGILACWNLTSLKIRHHSCLSWTAQEVDELSFSLPSVTTLMLNETPVQAPQPAVTIAAALSSFARHCSELRELGFCFDARSQPHAPVSKFKSLAVLHVGASPIDDSSESIEGIAAFLITILPVGCRMRWSSHGDEWSNDAANDEMDDGSFMGSPWQRIHQLQTLCRKVQKLLPGMI